MAIPKRLHLPGIYFITTVTWQRRRILQNPATAHLLIDTLQHYRRQAHYKLHAFVVMPDHLHLLLTPQDITLERALMLIKGGFSHRLQSTLPHLAKELYRPPHPKPRRFLNALRVHPPKSRTGPSLPTASGLPLLLRAPVPATLIAPP